MSFLLDPWSDKEPTGQDLNMLQGDCQLIVVAGRSSKMFRLLPIVPRLIIISDTTASTLTSLFYELVKSPTETSILRDEISSHITSGGTISNQSLQHLEALNGIISETLRLHPPTGLLQRKTPPEGLTIGETYIPGNTNVFCPQYVAARSKSRMHGGF